MEKKTFERKIVTEEDRNFERRYEENGWKIEKQELITKRSGVFSFSSEKLIKVHHLIREVTPVKVSLSISAYFPAYKIKAKNINAWDFHESIKEELRKRKLMNEDI